MDTTTSATDRATFGPIAARITRDTETIPSDFRGLTKRLARFELEVAGETILTDGPFTYGSSADRPHAKAREVLESVLSDLGSIVPHRGQGDELTDWVSWADELGYFSGDVTPAMIRESIDAYHEISARWQLIAERLEDGDDAVELLTRMGAAWDAGEVRCPRRDGAELEDAGRTDRGQVLECPNCGVVYDVEAWAAETFERGEI